MHQEIKQALNVVNREFNALALFNLWRGEFDFFWFLSRHQTRRRV